LWLLGYPDQVLARSREARALAEQTRHGVNIAFALTFTAVVHQARGEVEATRECAMEAITLATEQVLPFWASTARIFHGWALSKDGGSDPGIAERQRGLGETPAP